MAEFEADCQERGIPLFVLPPRITKFNGHVERANGRHRREFWEVFAGGLEMEPLRAAMRAWEGEYNHVRPHQALGCLTPAARLASLQDSLL